MHRRQFISRVMEKTLLGMAACSLSGCGTLMHSERRGQPNSGKIDWNMAALDGLGLILFFVPGVVAFAVDFSTGAIYLPAESAYPGSEGAPKAAAVPSPVAAAARAANGQLRSSPQGAGLTCVKIPREQLRPQGIEQTVGNHLGRAVLLDDDRTRLSRLAQIEQFDKQLSRHQADSDFGQKIRAFFS